MSDLLEGWSYPLSETVNGLKLLDHTFVKAPNKGPAWFDCFGGHQAAGEHKLEGASGQGTYAIANCYREPYETRPDTAGLGTYATCGVCHQAANRFLWSACTTFTGPTIKNCQGYMVSWSVYGTYGRPQGCPWPEPCGAEGWIGVPPADFKLLYAKCVGETAAVAAEPPAGVGAEPPAADAATRAERRIIALHHQLHATQKKSDHNAVADAELKIMAEEHLGSGFDHTKVREIRGRALNRAHKIATSDLRGAAYAHAVNGVGVQYLDEMEAHLGPELYSKLLRIPPKERYGLVDPDLAEKAGTRGTRA